MDLLPLRTLVDPLHGEGWQRPDDQDSIVVARGQESIPRVESHTHDRSSVLSKCVHALDLLKVPDADSGVVTA